MTDLQVSRGDLPQSLKPVLCPLETVQDTRWTATQVVGEFLEVESQVAQRQQTEPGPEQVLIHAQQMFLPLHHLE